MPELEPVADPTQIIAPPLTPPPMDPPWIPDGDGDEEIIPPGEGQEYPPDPPGVD
ncbi:hypothetical protein [Nocardiopsis alba]|uniref:hypothetical protein n=1 Tax=Nocardiopsis alba TaxID=53437 RepID=UPI003D726FAE